jgi:hypothetical protein
MIIIIKQMEIDTEPDKTNVYSFLNNTFLNELKGYKSIVNYKTIYENLSDDVRKDIILEAKRIFSTIPNNTESVNTSFYIDNVRNISDIQIDIEVYYMKYEYNDCIYIKAGFNVYLKNSINYIMQCMNFFNSNVVTNDSININYIYNILFYVHVFVNEFKFDSLFDHFYHKNDIELMKTMRLRSIRLFGNPDSECCVCIEKCITLTECGHILCNKCFSKLSIKICPMCRTALDNEEQNYNNVNFFIEHIPSLVHEQPHGT